MNSKIHKIYFEPATKVNVSGGYERLSTNGYVQDYDTLFWDANSSNALSLPTGRQAMPRKTVNPIILSDTLAQTFNNRSSVPIAIGIRCGYYRPSPRITFHSSRRSGGSYSLLFIVF